MSGEFQLEGMSLVELKALAKEHGIKHHHAVGVEKLKGIIAEALELVEDAPAPKPVQAKTSGKAESREFCRVAVRGSYRSRLNQHVKTKAQYEVEVNMPNDYNLGDLKRSLPIKLAPLFADFVGLRTIDFHEVVGPAMEGDKSDLVKKVKRGFKNAAKYQEAKEAGEMGENSDGIQIDITDEERQTGLPPVVNS